jgi:4-diphosphocytidyl-2-C-methyl-D-erythritol kinase
VRVRALAKINLSLRILGATSDGYHELRTVFQSIALHDTLAFEPAAGPFQIVCSDPSCPVDDTNLIWRAATAVWRAAKHRGSSRGLRIRLTKRIPIGAGLGGGSSDAAAALRACAAVWRVKLSPERLSELAATLGADVPYFLEGGTALGTEKGDRVQPLADAEPKWVTLVVPPFAISTKDAYGWWDEDRRIGSAPDDSAENDLQASVVARHAEIAQIVHALKAAGAVQAMLSGSGSAVYGLFATRTAAELAASALGAGPRGPVKTIITRTVNRMRYQALAAL